MENAKPKQVILVRTDIGMGPGKIASQVAHASMGVFFNRGRYEESQLQTANCDGTFSIQFTNAMADWQQGEFTKIILEVNSEEQLLSLYAKASLEKLPCCIIQDNGHTVFNGVKTYTTLGIGPCYPHDVDPITGGLKLLK